MILCFLIKSQFKKKLKSSLVFWRSPSVFMLDKDFYKTSTKDDGEILVTIETEL